jgi:hypothetical protein
MTAGGANIASAFLADVFGPSTIAPVFICSLANADARDREPGERHVATREPVHIEAFLRKWDRKDRALYFAVATVKPGSTTRSKATLAELNALHVDIDTKSITIGIDEAEQKLREVMHLPSKVVASGGGLHAYWLFKEAVSATPENITRIETVLRLLADHLGGDLACAEASHLMRLPGSHNTKNGAWTEVRVVEDRPLRYELDDLAEWLETASPVIWRKPTGGNGHDEEKTINPWLVVAERFGIKPPIDVEARLAAMRYQGAGDGGVHATQVSVSAALLNRGTPINEVVEVLLAATRAAAGSFGERWNWTREERAIRGMCETWLAKYPEKKATDDATANNAQSPDTDSSATADLFDPWQRFSAPAFPVEVLPATIRHFVATQSEVIGCDKSALAMACLAALSGAIDHRFALKIMRHGDWWTSPRLWVLLVGDPSIKKTPIINATTGGMDRLQADEWNKYQNDKKEYVAAGGDPNNFRPAPPRYTAYDVTTEKLGIILANQDRGILIKRDELAGWIGQMEKYTTGRGSFADRAFWLKAYDGGPFTVDRVSRADVRINNLSVSIVGGVQPSRLDELHGLTSDGLLQRFLPVLISNSSFPKDCAVTSEAEKYSKLLHRLAALEPKKLFLADDAVTAMTDLRQYLHDLELASPGIADGFQSFVGKLPGVAGNLSLILALADGPEYSPWAKVDKETVENVAPLIQEFLLPHAFEFYRKAHSIDRLQRLASWILTSGRTRIVASDLTVNVADYRGLGLMEINQRVSPLVAGGWLTAKEIGPVAKSWMVNPAVFARFQQRAEEEKHRKVALAKLMNSPRRDPDNPDGKQQS